MPVPILLHPEQQLCGNGMLAMALMLFSSVALRNERIQSKDGLSTCARDIRTR
jgi:hypothetical protein